MTIEFNCPRCFKSLSTSDDRAGWQVTCPGCSGLIHVPDKTGTAAFPQGASIADERAIPADESHLNGQAAADQEPEHSEASPHERRPRHTSRPFLAGDVFSETCQLFVDHLGLSIGSFIAFVFMITLIAAVPFGPLYLSESMADHGDTIGSMGAFVFSVVLFLTAIFVIVDLQSGYLSLQIKIARGQPAEISDLICGGRFSARLFFNSILFASAVAIGLMMFIIPGVAIAAMFFPFAHLIVDEDLPAMDCFRRAKQLTDGNLSSIILVFVVALTTAFVGATACMVGLIAAIPFINLLFAVAYNTMTCQAPLKSLRQEADSRSAWPTQLRKAMGRVTH